MTDEVWKEINGYPSYMISDKGRVKNCMRNKILKPRKHSHGYAIVALFDQGKRKEHYIHILVAKAFIPNPLNLPEVNHKDEVKWNNFKDNLEWVTYQKNIEHSKAKYYKLLSPSGEAVEVFNLNKFSRENGLHNSSLAAVVAGKRNHHKGWRVNN